MPSWPLPASRRRARRSWCEKARCLWRDLWQADPARETVREALQLVPEHAGAAELLQSFEAEDGGWQEQAEALSEKAAAAGEGPEAGRPLRRGSRAPASPSQSLGRGGGTVAPQLAARSAQPARRLRARALAESLWTSSGARPSTWRAGSRTPARPRKERRRSWRPGGWPSRPGRPRASPGALPARGGGAPGRRAGPARPRQAVGRGRRRRAHQDLR